METLDHRTRRRQQAWQENSEAAAADPSAVTTAAAANADENAAQISAYSDFLRQLARTKTLAQKQTLCRQYIADQPLLTLAQILNLTKFFDLEPRNWPAEPDEANQPRPKDYQVKIIAGEPRIVQKRKILSRLFSRNRIDLLPDAENVAMQKIIARLTISDIINFLSHHRNHKENFITILQSFLQKKCEGASGEEIRRNISSIFIAHDHAARSHKELRPLIIEAFTKTALQQPELISGLTTWFPKSIKSIFSNINDFDILTEFAKKIFVALEALYSRTGENIVWNHYLPENLEKRSCAAKALIEALPVLDLKSFLQILICVKKDERLLLLQKFKIDTTNSDPKKSLQNLRNALYNYGDEDIKLELIKQFFQINQSISSKDFFEIIFDLNEPKFVEEFFRTNPDTSLQSLTECFDKIREMKLEKASFREDQFNKSCTKIIEIFANNFPHKNINLENLLFVFDLIKDNGPLKLLLVSQFLNQSSQEIDLKDFVKIITKLEEKDRLEYWKKLKPEDLKIINPDDFIKIFSDIKDRESKLQFARIFIASKRQNNFEKSFAISDFLKITIECCEPEELLQITREFISSKKIVSPSYDDAKSADDDYVKSAFNTLLIDKRSDSVPISQIFTLNALIILVGYGEEFIKKGYKDEDLRDLFSESLKTIETSFDLNLTLLQKIVPIILQQTWGEKLVTDQILNIILRNNHLSFEKLKELASLVSDDNKILLYRSYAQHNYLINICQFSELLTGLDSDTKSEIYHAYLQERFVRKIVSKEDFLMHLDLLQDPKSTILFNDSSRPLFFALQNYIESITNYKDCYEVFDKISIILTQKKDGAFPIVYRDNWKLFFTKMRELAFRNIITLEQNAEQRREQIWKMLPLLNTAEIQLILENSEAQPQNEDELIEIGQYFARQAKIEDDYRAQTGAQNSIIERQKLTRVNANFNNIILKILENADPNNKLDQFISLATKFREQTAASTGAIITTSVYFYDNYKDLINKKSKNEADLIAMIPVFFQLIGLEGRSIIFDYIKIHNAVSSAKILACCLHNKISNYEVEPFIEAFFKQHDLTADQFQDIIAAKITDSVLLQTVVKRFALKKIAKNDVSLGELGKMLTKIGATTVTAYALTKESNYIDQYKKKHLPNKFLTSKKRFRLAQKQFILDLAKSGLVDEKFLGTDNDSSDFFKHVKASGLKLDDIIEIGKIIYPGASEMQKNFLQKYYKEASTNNQEITKKEFTALKAFLLSINPQESYELIDNLIKSPNNLKSRIHLFKIYEDAFWRLYPHFNCFKGKNLNQLLNDEAINIAKILKTDSGLPTEIDLTIAQFLILHNARNGFFPSNFLKEESADLFCQEFAKSGTVFFKEIKKIYNSCGLKTQPVKPLLLYLKNAAIKNPTINIESFELPLDVDLETAQRIKAGLQEIYNFAAEKNPNNYLRESAGLSEEDISHVAKTTDFFADLFAAPDLTKTLNLDEKVRIHNLFVANKDRFVHLLSTKDGIAAMQNLLTSAKDGCIANISSQFQQALYATIFTKPSEQILYDIFVEHILNEIQNELVTHNQTIFDHRKLTEGSLSIGNLVNAVRKTFIEEDLRTAKINVFDFLATQLLTEEQQALKTNSSTQYQKLLEENKVVLQAALKARDPIGEDQDELIEIMERAVAMAIGLVLEDLSAEFVAADSIDPSVKDINLKVTNAKKTIDIFFERKSWQEKFAEILKANLQNQNSSAVQNFLQQYNFEIGEIKLFCSASVENFELFAANLDVISEEWVAKNQDYYPSNAKNNFQIEVVSEYIAELIAQDEIDGSTQKLQDFYNQYPALFEKCENKLGQILKDKIIEDFSQELLDEAGKESKLAAIDNMFKALKTAINPAAKLPDGIARRPSLGSALTNDTSSQPQPDI